MNEESEEHFVTFMRFIFDFHCSTKYQKINGNRKRNKKMRKKNAVTSSWHGDDRKKNERVCFQCGHKVYDKEWLFRNLWIALFWMFLEISLFLCFYIFGCYFLSFAPHTKRLFRQMLHFLHPCYVPLPHLLSSFS